MPRVVPEFAPTTPFAVATALAFALHVRATFRATALKFHSVELLCAPLVLNVTFFTPCACSVAATSVESADATNAARAPRARQRETVLGTSPPSTGTERAAALRGRLGPSGCDVGNASRGSRGPCRARGKGTRRQHR